MLYAASGQIKEMTNTLSFGKFFEQEDILSGFGIPCRDIMVKDYGNPLGIIYFLGPNLLKSLYGADGHIRQNDKIHTGFDILPRLYS